LVGVLVPASCDYRLGIDIWMGEKSFSVAADDIIFGVNSEVGKFTSMFLVTPYMTEDSILNEENER